MRMHTDQERWVLAVGEVVDEIVDLAAAEQDSEVVNRLPHAVLVRTTYRKAWEIRKKPNAIVHVYDSEQAGRRALSLFEP
jgi:hypothetical protein